MLPKAKSAKYIQYGFTMIELLITVAIMGTAGIGITTTILMIRNESERSASHINASHQIQHAGNWITRDAAMAQSVDTSDDVGTVETEVCTLKWQGWPRTDHWDHQYIDTFVIRYSYDSNQIHRHETVTTDEYDDDGVFQTTTQNTTVQQVADNITALSITSATNNISVTLTALVEGFQAERTYEITTRPG